MTALLITLALLTLLWLALALSPAHRASFSETLDVATPLPDPPSWPAVAVVVPARNEAEMLPSTLPTICGQDYPDLRVILVDDHSDDATPSILADLRQRHPNLTVVQADECPAGWYGKPWAVTCGVRAAGEPPYLLFTDADIHFHPAAVRQAMRLLHHTQARMVSLLPQMVMGTAVERVGLAGLVSVLSMMFPTPKANDPRSSIALAAGGFILIDRSAYEQVGGHESVKNQIIEDVNLARRLKAAAVPTHTRLTRDLVSTRMYDGLADLWEGLAKNAYAGMEYQPRKFWVGLIFGLAFIVLPPLYLLIAAVTLTGVRTPRTILFFALALLMWLTQTVVHARTTRHLRLPWYHALLMPISLALYSTISAWSAWQHHYGKGTLWKGRHYTKEMAQPA